MLRRIVPLGFLLALAVLAAGPAIAADQAKTAKAPAWSMNATIIEACSCPMFCQCYFTNEPAAHAGHEGHGEGEHFCRFNNAYKVNKGSYGSTKLDGAKFWVAGDLGAEFGDGECDWAVLTFDKSTTKEQRDAIATIIPNVYPVKWKSFNTSEGAIEWSSTRELAFAKLDGGQTAEVKLVKKVNSNVAAEPTVIKNLRYLGAPRNEGFVLMPSEVEAYRVGEKPFEYKGTNGFMITFDINSKDVAQTKASSGSY